MFLHDSKFEGYVQYAGVHIQLLKLVILSDVVSFLFNLEYAKT
ncbi:hypothetical protein HMPREF1872_01119 [Amygdalobacter nucleatus]|uniref:Uncharacterized protein n=1 Tax=Amygdalobacter nucleatus TaxID=3029274 RepID=A0A133Y8X2_9FIRM|nr:hypothetical protein HMPREF1872_01119 [Amygdalobacter nucleatus]